jgi:uncharacterized repeat protein (TIGR01451 family)
VEVNGEVEDYAVSFAPVDFGDAPNTYGTTGPTAAAHPILAIGNPRLGAVIDPELDGQPNVGANGDDLAGGVDDEDGVTFAPIRPGAPTTLVGGPTGGVVSCWIDFNRNGTFDDPTERAVTNQTVAAGATVPVSFTVPTVINPGESYARCRISTVSNLTPISPAPNGEVEDYPVRVGVYDLRILKTLSPGQSPNVVLSALVSFTITVTNEGDFPVTNVVVYDLLPAGLQLNDSNWTVVSNTARRTIAGPIAPGASASVTLIAQVTDDISGGVTNLVEIASFLDRDGLPGIDVDSSPDTNPFNDPVDEDDVSRVGINLPVVSIPVDNPFALLMLVLGLLWLSTRQLRRG